MMSFVQQIRHVHAYMTTIWHTCEHVKTPLFLDVFTAGSDMVHIVFIQYVMGHTLGPIGPAGPRAPGYGNCLKIV